MKALFCFFLLDTWARVELAKIHLYPIKAIHVKDWLFSQTANH